VPVSRSFGEEHLSIGGTFSFEEALQSDSPSYFGKIKLFDGLFEYVPISEGELKDTLEKSSFSIRSFKTIKLLFMSGCFVRATKGGDNQNSLEENNG